MGGGCSACKRESEEKSKANSCFASNCKGEIQLAKKTQVKPIKMVESPKESLRNIDSLVRHNSSPEGNTPPSFNKPNIERKSEKKSPRETWIAIAKKDSNSEPFEKFRENPGGVLLEFKPKTLLSNADNAMMDKSKRAADIRKNVLLKMTPPCLDQIETASFGKRDSIEYKKQLSAGSNSSNTDIVIIEPKKNAPSKFAHQSSIKNTVAGKKLSGTGDSFAFQRGTSLTTGENLVLTASCVSDDLKKSKDLNSNVNSVRIENEEELMSTGIKLCSEFPKIEKIDKSQLVPALPQSNRVVRAVAQDKYDNYKHTVCKNILKEVPTLLVGISDQRDTSTKSKTNLKN